MFACNEYCLCPELGPRGHADGHAGGGPQPAGRVRRRRVGRRAAAAAAAAAHVPRAAALRARPHVAAQPGHVAACPGHVPACAGHVPTWTGHVPARTSYVSSRTNHVPSWTSHVPARAEHASRFPDGPDIPQRAPGAKHGPHIAQPGATTARICAASPTEHDGHGAQRHVAQQPAAGPRRAPAAAQLQRAVGPVRAAGRPRRAAAARLLSGHSRHSRHSRLALPTCHRAVRARPYRCQRTIS